MSAWDQIRHFFRPDPLAGFQGHETPYVPPELEISDIYEHGKLPEPDAPEIRDYTDERPSPNWERMDWMMDVRPYLEHRLGLLLRELLQTQDAEQFRYKQGRAQELYDVIHAPERERWLDRERARKERARERQAGAR